MTTLNELLAEVTRLFPARGREQSGCYDFILGKFPAGWNFGVTNSWYLWSQAELKHDFGCYAKPEDAVRAFLDYVHAKNINVEELME